MEGEGDGGGLGWSSGGGTELGSGDNEGDDRGLPSGARGRRRRDGASPGPCTCLNISDFLRFCDYVSLN